MLKTILIADDEPNICRIAKLLISPDDYTIITAKNGQEAYEKAIQYSPDAIFSDVLMPKCDGFELCKRLKENDQTKSISFILLTDSNDATFQQRSSVVRADDCLSKPFTSEDFLHKIQFWTAPTSIEAQTHSENLSVSVDNIFQLGIPELDQQLLTPISPETFILAKGTIGNGQPWLTRQFIHDGLNRYQHSLLLSFELPKQKLYPLLNIPDQSQPYFHFLEASNWTNLDSKPWRNLDFIYDQLCDICNQVPIQRIVIDSISHGTAFWSTKDILTFINLCRSLPNFDQQCILWTFNSHACIDELEFHLSNCMDIGLSLIHSNHNIYRGTIDFSKWHPFNNTPVVITGD